MGSRCDGPIGVPSPGRARCTVRPVRARIVGMIGAGQLARMSQAPAAALHIDLRLLANSDDDSAAQMIPGVRVGSAASVADIVELAREVEVLTVEHELIDTTALDAVAERGIGVFPSGATLRVAQDKHLQRQLFERLGLPSPAWRVVGTADDVAEFARLNGWPVILKSAMGGYDGRGVAKVADATEAALAMAEMAADEKRVVVAEACVPLAAEVAVVAARSTNGSVVTWPVTATVQAEGICRELLVPSGLPSDIDDEARRVASDIATAIDAVGVVAVEFFVDDVGRLLVNEIATRPHNSGHWTIDGAVTSQFENHLRAVLGWELGSPDLVAPAVASANLLAPADGTDPASRLPQALASDPHLKVHLYGKEPRPGRKVGHVTVAGADLTDVRRRARAAAALLTGEVIPDGC